MHRWEVLVRKGFRRRVDKRTSFCSCFLGGHRTSDLQDVPGGQVGTMQQQAEEDELGLSSAALAALKEFALENDILGELPVPVFAASSLAALSHMLSTAN